MVNSAWTASQDLIRFIPSSPIDDFFFFGFLGGIVGYLYYNYATREFSKHHTTFLVGMYGAIISGLLGGLLAIVFDRSIELAILVGLLNQVLYMTIIKGVASGEFWPAVKEVLIKLLTGGQKL